MGKNKSKSKKNKNCSRCDKNTPPSSLFGGILVRGLICSPFGLNRLISFFGKNKSGSEETRYCSRCGKTTLHSYISEYELKCKECGNVTEED